MSVPTPLLRSAPCEALMRPLVQHGHNQNNRCLACMSTEKGEVIKASRSQVGLNVGIHGAINTHNGG